MRIFTVIAGILICGTGAFSFAVYTNPFTDIAFLVGMVMVISGVCNILSYLVSGRGENRLTDTALVEGLVTMLYGFAVLNNQVTDAMLTMFFGTWLTLCGATRISQSFYVSRFNPRDWSKIVPLAAVTCMLGIVMMMPELVVAVMPLMLLGGAFIVDGLSLLVYAMYMKRKTAGKLQGEIEARERAEAKKAMEIAKRTQRDELRQLSKKERKEAKALIRQKEYDDEVARRDAKQAERDARREALRPATERTRNLKDEEVEAINKAAPKEQIEASKAAEAAAIKAAAAKAAEANLDIIPDTVVVIDDSNAGNKPDYSTIDIDFGDDEENAPVKDELAEEEKLPEKKEEGPVATEDDIQALAAASKPVWKMPSVIPSVRNNDGGRSSGKGEVNKPKLAAVNLADVESRPAMDLGQIVLPEFKLDSDGFDKIDREDILKEITETKLPQAMVTDYTPINLEELAAEPIAKAYDPKELTRFTQTLKFDWLEAPKNEK